MDMVTSMVPLCASAMAFVMAIKKHLSHKAATKQVKRLPKDAKTMRELFKKDPSKFYALNVPNIELFAFPDRDAFVSEALSQISTSSSVALRSAPASVGSAILVKYPAIAEAVYDAVQNEASTSLESALHVVFGQSLTMILTLIFPPRSALRSST